MGGATQCATSRTSGLSMPKPTPALLSIILHAFPLRNAQNARTRSHPFEHLARAKVAQILAHPRSTGIRTVRVSTRRPRTRDPVHLDGRIYRIAAEALAPEPGFWLGCEDGPVVCERFVPRSAWAFVWDARRERWEPERTTETTYTTQGGPHAA